MKLDKKEGKKLEAPSRYLCLEMPCDPNTGNPFCYDFLVGMNTWCKPYELEITLKEDAALATILGQKIIATVDPVVDHQDAVIPQMKHFVTDGVFRGTDGKELTYGYYAPKGQKLPLVIWLHGAGEGGTDPSIAFLGNKASALLGEEFQQAMGGAAYVLLPQTPTFWLQYNEAGDWGNNPGVPSVYTQTLKELIDNFVAEHPAIDRDRILIGGCSNGGYMTVNMAIQYPGYFAAAYPICEAYKDSGITPEQLDTLKDLPMWFVYAENDTTVDPARIAAIFREEGIIPAAQLAAFTDPVSGYTDRSMAVHYSGTQLWLDNVSAKAGGKSWLDPSAASAVQYVGDLIDELHGMGFEQVVLTGVQFPNIITRKQEFAAAGGKSQEGRAALLAADISTWQARFDGSVVLWLSYPAQQCTDASDALGAPAVSLGMHNLIVTADTLDAAARGQLQQSAAEAGVQNVVICSTESFQ